MNANTTLTFFLYFQVKDDDDNEKHIGALLLHLNDEMYLISKILKNQLFFKCTYYKSGVTNDIKKK